MISIRKNLIIVFFNAMLLFSQDISWFNYTKDTLYISSEEHLKGLIQLVNIGNDKFNGRTIILNSDITLTDIHTPIGWSDNNSSLCFTGTFDGNGHSINNLSISGYKQAGLFGCIDKAGQIKNLVVNVSKITTGDGKSSSYSESGGLVGYYNSINPIENCVVNINDSIIASASGEAYSGGLVGYAFDKITINNSCVMGNVSAATSAITSAGSFSGGLVGYSVSATTINNSYIIGNVSSYSPLSSSIGSTSYSGGLIGSCINNLFIANSYANADVLAVGEGSYIGGIFGYWARGENNSVYFNSSHADNAAGVGSPSGVLGKTSNELKQKETFIGWDFENIWDIDPKINDGYPFLRGLNTTPTSIVNVQKSDSRYGIRFMENIVSENAEISIILPNNEKSINTEIIIYDMTGNVVFETNTINDKISWNLTNTAGRSIANGSYLVIAEAKSISGNIYRYSAKLGVKR